MANQEEEEFEVEQIPSDDSVSRGCFNSPGIDQGSNFLFPSANPAESVYWRKYANTIESVHERGCKLANDRSTKKDLVVEYSGSITALVESIRDIKTERGYSVMVDHLPENCDRSHAHLCVLDPNGSRKFKKFPPNDRIELVAMLCNKSFGSLEKHNCGT